MCNDQSGEGDLVTRRAGCLHQLCTEARPMPMTETYTNGPTTLLSVQRLTLKTLKFSSM